MEVSVILPRLSDRGRFSPFAPELVASLKRLDQVREVILLDAHPSQDDFFRLAKGLDAWTGQVRLWPLADRLSWPDILHQAAEITLSPALLFLPPKQSAIRSGPSLLEHLCHWDAVYRELPATPLTQLWQRLCPRINAPRLPTMGRLDWQCLAITRCALLSVQTSAVAQTVSSDPAGQLLANGYRVCGSLSCERSAVERTTATEATGTTQPERPHGRKAA